MPILDEIDAYLIWMKTEIENPLKLRGETPVVVY